MKKTKILGLPYAVWMVIFIVLPIFLMFVYAVRNSAGEYTLNNFRDFFTPTYFRILWDSVYMAGISTVICLVLGYPVAMIITKMPEKKRNIFLVLIIMPTWMNFLLRTYSWMNILGKNGLINKLLSLLGIAPMDLLYNDGAVLLGMVYNFLPFMIYPIYSVLIKISPSYLEAAKDLGANAVTAFRKVTLPLSVPGIITGITMVFMPAVSTFVISDLLGGGTHMYMGNLISHQFLQKGDWNFGSAVSFIMMIVILLVMCVTNKFSKTDKESV